MSALLALDPFGRRRDDALLEEMNALSAHHLQGSSDYARLWAGWKPAKRVEDLPFLHVGVFKHVKLKTETAGIHHQRTLTSSSTSGSAPSQIILDDRSSALQSQSVLAIHRAMIGGDARPLLILDEAQALRQAGTLSARLAAALSLLPLASETHFLLKDARHPDSVQWNLLQDVLAKNSSIILYGATWTLWQAWAAQKPPHDVEAQLQKTRVDYVHSGGWKKLEDIKVDRRQFDQSLVSKAAPSSRVMDYYGLSEQVGILFPLCSQGRRHAPVWSEVLVRDPYTMTSVMEEPGLLQLMNPLAWGAPYHNVLTEDVGRCSSGECPCGLPGRHFELLGRVPRAEVRGCANV